MNHPTRKKGAWPTGPRVHRAAACAALLTLALSAPIAALECTVSSPSPSFLSDSVPFSLQCDSPLNATVAWEFGDGTTRDQAPGQTVVRHQYDAIGSYTVFARVQGEPFAFIKLHSVLHPLTPRPPTQSATVLYDPMRNRVWNVNADNNSATLTDARAFVRLAEIPVGRNPRTLALDTLGRVWVVNQDDATLSILDGGGAGVLHTITLPYASRPYGIAFAPGGRTGYVTLQATGKLLRVDAVSRAVTGSLDVFPTPRGIAVTHDGSRILVTRHISPSEHGEVAEVNAETFSLTRVIHLRADTRPDSEDSGPGVPNALSSITISPDGRRAWVPFKKDNVGRGLFVDPPGGTPTFENTVRTSVALIDLAAGAEDTAARMDLNNRSKAFAASFDSRGAFTFVTTLTSNHTVIINNATGTGATAIEPVGPLTDELAPDGAVVDPADSLLFVHYFMSRQIAVYDITQLGVTNIVPRRTLIPTVAKERLSSAVLKGKQIFYNAADPRMARDRYISCAVCHLDGSTDGRVWDFTHKGEGLRRTTSLLGRGGLAHGPVHWTANFDEIQDFEHDVRDAFGGTGLMNSEDFNAGTRNTPLGTPKAGRSADLDALAAYVSSLVRVNASPYRNSDGSMTAAATAGEAIFNSAETRCAQCHTPPRYTDSHLQPAAAGSGVFVVPGGFLLHDVGTLKAGSGKRLNDTLRGLDTPTLLGIWETGPYLHDGSALTLQDVLTTANPQDRHGKTSHLSPQELDQLVAFLRQLDQSGEPVGVAGKAPRPASGMLSLRKVGSGFLLEWRVPDAEASGRVTLRIFDASGRVIATLRPQAAPARGVFMWDGRDDRQRPVTRGVYGFRLDWEGGNLTQRAVLTP